MKKLLFLIPFLLVLYANATNYYFDNTPGVGNDANSCSLASPCATNAKFNSIIFHPGDSALFKCGDTWTGQKFFVNQSGTAGNVIYVGSYGFGALPFMTGWASLGPWTSLGSNVYEAFCPTVKAYDNMFLNNGTRGTFARTPNSGVMNYTATVVTTLVDGNDLASAPSYVGLRAAIKSSTFTWDVLGIIGQTTSTLTLAAPGMSYTGAGGSGWFVLGTRPDAPNEYLPNAVTDSVLFYSTTAPSGTITLATTDTLLYSQASYVVVSGIHFQGANIAAVLFKFSNNGHDTVRNCTFDYMGQDAITMTAVSFAGVYGNNIKYCNSNGFTLTPNEGSVRPYIVNDTIKHIGEQDGQGASGGGNYIGVVAYAPHAFIYGIVMDSVGYSGITTSGDSTIVRRATISNFCKNLSDGGGIYWWDGADSAYQYWRMCDSNVVSNGVGSKLGATFDSADAAPALYFDGHTRAVMARFNNFNGCSSGIYSHGKVMNLDSNTIYNNIWAQILITEASGIPISSVQVIGNLMGSDQMQEKGLAVTTVNASLPTLTINKNNYIMNPGALTTFYTKSSSATSGLTFAGWQGLGYDLTSSQYINSQTVYRANGTASTVQAFVPLTYFNLAGTSFSGSVPLAPYQSLLLFNPTNTFVIPSPGEYLMYYLNTNGLVYGCSNAISLLGTNNVGSQGVPVKVVTNPVNKVQAVICAGLHNGLMADADSGNVRITGSPSWVSDGGGTNYNIATLTTDSAGNPFFGVTELAAGWNIQNSPFYIAKKADGTVWMIGDLTNGNRGNGTAGSVETGWVQVNLTGGKLAKHVNASQSPLVVTTDDSVETWGGGNDYQQNLGYAWTGTQNQTPHVLAVGNIAYAAKGGGFNYLVSKDATPKIYFYGIYGSYGGRDNSFTFDPVTTPTNITATLNLRSPVDTMVCNHLATKALLKDGSQWAWGGGDYGLGNGDQIDWLNYKNQGGTSMPYNSDIGVGEHLIPKPVNIMPGKNNFLHLYGGPMFCFYFEEMDSSGQLFADGRNKGGVLGNQIIPADTLASNVQAIYPCSWNVPTSAPIKPLSIARAFVSTSPYCILNPNGSPCSDYHIPAHTPPTPIINLSTDANNNIYCDGTGSTDAVFIAYYRWTVDSPVNSITQVRTQGAIKDTFLNVSPGTYKVTLHTTNTSWDSAAATAYIVVGGTPPNVSAGQDQVIRLPVSSTVLSGTATGNGGTTIVSTLWTQVSGPNNAAITSPTSLTTTVTGMIAGTYVFQLSATDSNNNSASDQMNVVVQIVVANNVITKKHQKLIR